jgi:Family of unknown function (DUF6011)
MFPEHDLEEMIAAPKGATVTPPANYRPMDFTQPCRKCGGSKVFRSYSGRVVGPCFACKGEGSKTFKTSPVARAKAAVARVERKQADAASAVAAFAEAHPAVWTWMNGSSFPFAVSLKDALERFGSLTANQLAAAEKCAAKLAEKRAEKAADAPVVEVSALEKAFDAAVASGLKYPRLRVAGIAVTPARAGSKNAGALYVKAGDQYLGKITGGQFFATRECTTEQKAKVVEVVSDPEAAAKAYGIETGTCSCCGRELTDPVSVANGIGPICATKYGWG